MKHIIIYIFYKNSHYFRQAKIDLENITNERVRILKNHRPIQVSEEVSYDKLWQCDNEILQVRLIYLCHAWHFLKEKNSLRIPKCQGNTEEH